MKKLRIGIVGCGSAGKGHISIIRRIEDVSLVAVCDTDKLKAKETAARFGIPNYYKSLEEMLKAEKELDVVDICTPPQFHASLAIQAMEFNKHVIVEKPMSLTTSQADEMIRASKKFGVKLCVVHNALFNPMFMKARSIVKEGLLGDIVGVDIKWIGWAPHADLDKHPSWILDIPGGVFGEALPHPVYLQLALLGQIRDVYVISKHLKHWPVPDELRVILDGGNSIGIITMSLNMPRTLGTVEIFGTKMTLFFDLWSPTMIRYKPRKDDYLSLALDNLSSCTQILTSTALAALKKPFGKLRSSHEVLIPKIIESIRNDKEPPISEKEGREVVRIVECICNQIQVYR